MSIVRCKHCEKTIDTDYMHPDECCSECDICGKVDCTCDADYELYVDQKE